MNMLPFQSITKSSELQNGLQIYFCGTVTYLASLGIWLPIGSAFEESHQTGISHLIEHLSFRALKAHPSGDFSQWAEKKGAIFGAQTGPELIGYYCRVPIHNFSEAADVLGEMAFGPLNVDPDTFRRELDILKEEALTHFSPADKSMRLALNNLYPMNYQVLPDAIAVESETQLIEFRNENFHPNGALLLVFHPNKDLALKQAIEIFAKYQSRSLQKLKYQEIKDYERKRSYSARIPTCHVAVAFPGPPYGSDDRDHLAVLNRVLTLGFGSRIYRRLVSEDARAYAIKSEIDAFRFHGGYAIGASSSHDPNSFSSYFEEIILEEVVEIAQNGISQGEIDRAVERYISYLYLLSENNTKLSLRIALNLFHHRKAFDPEEIAKRLRQSTPNRYAELAERYLNPTQASIAILKPIV